MNVYKIRLDNVRSLIQTEFDGKQNAFAKAIDRSAPQVNQWLSEQRNIGAAVARDIEKKLGKYPEWLDGKPFVPSAKTQKKQGQTPLFP